MTVRIEARMHGLLRLLIPHSAGQSVLPLGDSATVRDLLAQLNAGDQTWLVAVNNVVVRLDRVLEDGDVVDCYPPIVGG